MTSRRINSWPNDAYRCFIVFHSYVNYSTGLKFTLNLTNPVRQANALTVHQAMLTEGTLVSVRPIPNLRHTSKCTQAGNAELPWDQTLAVCAISRPFKSWPNDAHRCFLVFNSTY